MNAFRFMEQRRVDPRARRLSWRRCMTSRPRARGAAGRGREPVYESGFAPPRAGQLRTATVLHEWKTQGRRSPLCAHPSDPPWPRTPWRSSAAGGTRGREAAPPALALVCQRSSQRARRGVRLWPPPRGGRGPALLALWGMLRDRPESWGASGRPALPPRPSQAHATRSRSSARLGRAAPPQTAGAHDELLGTSRGEACYGPRAMRPPVRMRLVSVGPQVQL
jgi:hypothetical protein